MASLIKHNLIFYYCNQQYGLYHTHDNNVVIENQDTNTVFLELEHIEFFDKLKIQLTLMGYKYCDITGTGFINAVRNVLILNS